MARLPGAAAARRCTATSSLASAITPTRKMCYKTLAWPSCGIVRFANPRDEEGFLPWVREIARRRVLGRIVDNISAKRYSIPRVVCPGGGRRSRVEEKLPASSHHAALMACLETLPPDSRRLIAQRYDGVDAATLATRFRRSVQAVYAQIKRIKVALRHCVERRLTAVDPLGMMGTRGRSPRNRSRGRGARMLPPADHDLLLGTISNEPCRPSSMPPSKHA